MIKIVNRACGRFFDRRGLPLLCYSRAQSSRASRCAPGCRDDVGLYLNGSPLESKGPGRDHQASLRGTERIAREDDVVFPGGGKNVDR
jgi:hypothetical protein